MSEIKLDKSEISLNDRNSITGSSGSHNLTGRSGRFQPVRIKALLSLFESEDDDTEPRDSDNDSDTESLTALPEDDIDDISTPISPQHEEPTVVQFQNKIDRDQVGVSVMKNVCIDEKISDNIEVNEFEDLKQTDHQISFNSNSVESRNMNALPSSVRKPSFTAPFKHLDNNRINFTPQASVDPLRNRMYNQGSILSDVKLEGRQENGIDFDNQSKPKEPLKNMASETPLKHGVGQNAIVAHRNIFETPQTKSKTEPPQSETSGLIFSHWSWNNFLQTPTQNPIIPSKKEGGGGHGQINHQVQDVRLQPHRFCNSENRIVRRPLAEAVHLNQGSSMNENRNNHVSEQSNFIKGGDVLTKENCPITDSKCNSKVNVATKIVQSLPENYRQHDVNQQSISLAKDEISNSLGSLEMAKTRPLITPKEQTDYRLISSDKIVRKECEPRRSLTQNSEVILNSKNNNLVIDSRTRRSNSMSSNSDVLKIDPPLPAVASESDPVHVQYSVPTKAADKKPGQIIHVQGSNYLVLGKLGHGMSGEVLRVQDVKTGELRAIKCVDLSCMESENAKGCLEEVSMLSRLRAPCIVNMIAYEIRSNVLYVVMEMGDTDLSTLLKSLSREKQLPLTMVLYYWTEMLTAVKHIHDNGVIHSDLKPANFLLVRGRLKLIDFGIASTVNAEMTSVVRNSSLGTLNYMSPEAIINVGGNGDSSSDDNQYKINYKSDVWSLGCILYSMVYGQTPFQQIRVHWAKINAITNPNEKIAFPPPESTNRRGYTPPPPFLVEVIQRCLQHDRKARPTVEQLLQIPYVGCNCPPVSSQPSIPASILLKIRRSLEESEWRKLLETLEGRRPIQ